MITKTPGCEGLRERAMKRTGALKNIQQIPALNPKLLNPTVQGLLDAKLRQTIVAADWVDALSCARPMPQW